MGGRAELTKRLVSVNENGAISLLIRSGGQYSISGLVFPLKPKFSERVTSE